MVAQQCSGFNGHIDMDQNHQRAKFSMAKIYILYRKRSPITVFHKFNSLQSMKEGSKSVTRKILKTVIIILVIRVMNKTLKRIKKG